MLKNIFNNMLVATILGFIQLTMPSVKDIQELDEAKFAVCSQISNISPDASSEEYQKLAKNLQTHGLSTCECIRDYLLMREKLEVQKVIEQEIKSGPDIWQTIETEIQEKRAQEKPGITIDPQLSENIDIQVLQDTYNYANVGTAIKAITHRSLFGEWAGVESPKKSPISNLYIGRHMRLLNKNAQRGVWLHEFTHIKNMHFEKKVTTFVKMNASWKSIKQLGHYHEKEADRIPAACGCAQDAQDLELACQASLKVKQESSWFWKIRKLSRFYESFIAMPHCKFATRIKWATRIRKLKEAEQALNSYTAHTKT